MSKTWTARKPLPAALLSRLIILYMLNTTSLPFSTVLAHSSRKKYNDGTHVIEVMHLIGLEVEGKERGATKIKSHSLLTTQNN